MVTDLLAVLIYIQVFNNKIIRKDKRSMICLNINNIMSHIVKAHICYTCRLPFLLINERLFVDPMNVIWVINEQNLIRMEL